MCICFRPSGFQEMLDTICFLQSATGSKFSHIHIQTWHTAFKLCSLQAVKSLWNAGEREWSNKTCHCGVVTMCRDIHQTRCMQSNVKCSWKTIPTSLIPRPPPSAARTVYMHDLWPDREKRREGLVYFVTWANIYVDIILTLGAHHSSIGRHRLTAEAA